MDNLLAAGWVPVGAQADPGAVFPPWVDPATRRKNATDPLWEGIDAENAKANAAADRRNSAGLIASSGLPPPQRFDVSAPDASSPAVNYALSGGAPTASPNWDQAGMIGNVPMPRPRPDVPSREVDGSASNAPTDVSSSDRGSVRPQASANVGGSMTAPVPQPAPQGDGGFSPGAMFGRMGNFLQNNSNTLLALGAGFAGAPNIGQGISRASAAAIPASQADIKNRTTLQSQSGTYRALIEAGVPPNQAIGAIGNPDMMKALVKSYIEDRGKEIKIIKDSLGNEVPYIVDKFAGPGEPMMKPAIADGGAASGTGMGALAHLPVEIDPRTGRDEKFLEAFRKADPVNAAAAENILAGNSAGTGRNLQQLQKYAERIDPNFNQATFAGRQNLYKSYYGGGEGFKQLRAANTAIDHGMQLADATKRLNNFSLLPDFLNKTTGMVEAQYSKPYQSALKDFEAARATYAHELETALTGKSTVSGYKEIHDLFDPYAGPASNESALHSTLGKLQSRVEEHESSYSRGMGGKASTAPVKDFLTNKSKLDALLNGEGAPPAKGGAAASGTVKVGDKVIPWSVH